MIEQVSNPDASVAGLKGQKGKALKGGLFAKFLAAFQKQVQKGASAVPSAAQPSVQVSGRHNKLSGAEMLSLKKEQTLTKGVKLSIPFQIQKAESGEAIKEAFLGSLKGENSLSISKEKNDTDEDLSGVVAGLGVARTEHTSLLSKNVTFGEQAANGEGKKGKNNLFTSNQQNTSQNTQQIKLNSSEDLDLSTKEKVFSGDPLKNRSEKPSAVLSSVLTTAVSSEKGSQTKATSISASVFGFELQKQTSESTGESQLISTSKRSEILNTSKNNASEGAQLKAETATSKEVKQSYQANASSHTVTVAEGELGGGERLGEQRSQKVSQRGELQSRLSGEGLKATPENRANQVEQMDAPANPLIQNSKARTAAQAQQVQLVQVNGTERIALQAGGQSPGNFQQDSSTSQQPEALLTDSSRADLKGVRGADFSAHMNYKTAQAFKPAEVMLEIARSAKDGAMKLELQLEPAHLGKVQITLQSDAAKQLQIHIAVDQTVSRQMLEQHLPQLRMALAQQGLDLGQFSMGMSSQGGEDGSSETGRSPFSGFSNLNGAQGNEQDESSVRLGINTASDGRISILA